jgi:hypothetical protein
MDMAVDTARQDELAGGVYHLVGPRQRLADRDDAPAADTDIAL